MPPHAILVTLVRGLLGRLLTYGALALGFWLLFQGFSKPSVPAGLLGGAAILGGMYFMVVVRRSTGSGPATDKPGDKEDNPSDSFDGSDKGD